MEMKNVVWFIAKSWAFLLAFTFGSCYDHTIKEPNKPSIVGTWSQETYARTYANAENNTSGDCKHGSPGTFGSCTVLIFSENTLLTDTSNVEFPYKLVGNKLYIATPSEFAYSKAINIDATVSDIYLNTVMSLPSPSVPIELSHQDIKEIKTFRRRTY